MSRKVLPILLAAAVVLNPGALAAAFESPPPDASLYWTGDSTEPAPDVTSHAGRKATALTPASVDISPPSEELLHQRPFFREWGVSRLPQGSRLIRAPPIA